MKRYVGVVCCLCLASCSGKPNGEHPPYPTSGQLYVNGQPVKGARVVFHHLGDWGEKSIVPQAETGEDGRFVLTTYAAKDGAPAGDYKVSIHWPAYRVGKNVGPDRLGGKYVNPQSTPLQAKVVEGTNELEPFKLTENLIDAKPPANAANATNRRKDRPR